MTYDPIDTGPNDNQADKAVVIEQAVIGSDADAPVLENERDNAPSDLTVKPGSGNTVGSVDVFPAGTEDRSHFIVANDPDEDNFGFVKLEVDGETGTISPAAKGTGTTPTLLVLENFERISVEDPIDFVSKLRTTPTTRTISSGSLSAAASFIKVNGEGGAADDLDTLTPAGAVDEGAIVILKRGDADITVKDATGNIRLDGSTDQVLDNNVDRIMLQYDADSSIWVELSRTNDT